MIFHFWRNGSGNTRAGGPHTFISPGIQKRNEKSHTAAWALHSFCHCNVSVKHSIKRKPRTSASVASNSFSVTVVFFLLQRWQLPTLSLRPFFLSLSDCHIISPNSKWATVCMWSYCLETALKGSPEPGWIWIVLLLRSPCMSLSRWLTNHSVTVLWEIKSILWSALLFSFT